MVNKKAVAAGNWSNTATWDGGTLPASGEDVYANGFAVVIDQDIAVASLRTQPASGISGGGSFTVSSGPRTIAADIYAGGTTGHHGVIANAACTITGNVTGGTASSGATYGVNVAASVTVTINGNVAAGTGSATNIGVNMANGSTVTVNGNVSASTSSNSSGIVTTGASATNVNVNGIVTGSVSGSSKGISIGGAGTRVTVVGSVRGGSGSGGYGIYGAVSGCAIRLDADVRWGTAAAPIDGFVKPQFISGGSSLSVTSPSDANWPLATGADVVLVEESGGPDQRYTLAVGDSAVTPG